MVYGNGKNYFSERYPISINASLIPSPMALEKELKELRFQKRLVKRSIIFMYCK